MTLVEQRVALISEQLMLVDCMLGGITPDEWATQMPTLVDATELALGISKELGATLIALVAKAERERRDFERGWAFAEDIEIPLGEAS